MYSHGRIGDGPAVLQLHRWSQMQLHLDLSEFCEASISPTRDLLLLLSHQCEALLFPLVSGKEPCHSLMKKENSGKFYLGDLQKPSSLSFPSSEQSTNCRSNSSVDATSSCRSPENDSSPVSTSYSMISDVKSFAWGHCGDAYREFKNSGFREILIVCGDDGIIAHAFRYRDKNTSSAESESDGAFARGKWVEWGPTKGTQANEQLPHSHTFKNFNGSKETKRNVENQYSHCGSHGIDTSSSISMQRHWFQSFQTEIYTVVSNQKFLARFPAESSFPNSTEVVSFKICDSTSRFLDFVSCRGSHSGKADLCEVTADVALDNTQTVDSPHEHPSYLLSKAARTGILYKCSRVFSSSSHRLLGLVLDSSDSATINSKEDRLKVDSKNLVVVLVLYQWGLQWVCSVDLHNQFPASGPNPQWKDFQFSENFLVCLSTSGLICIWGAKTGDFVARFDVLQSCGLGAKVYSGDWPKVSVSRDSALKIASFDGLSLEETDVNETLTFPRERVHSRTFRRLMVDSHSLLLAVIDDNEVTYIISAGDYISEKNYVLNKFMPSCDLGILEGWKVAGCEIVGQKVFSNLSKGQGLHASELSSNFSSNADMVAKLERSHQIKCQDSQLYSISSGFTNSSQINGRKMPYSGCEMSSAPIRRIFLPSENFNKEDSICFSPFGITRLVRSNSREQKVFKIVHSGLHVAPSFIDEREIDTCLLSGLYSTKESAFVGESIGCSFQGSLYLVTQDGLSVILPSVSVSSDMRPTESIKYWQPRAVASSKYQVENSLELSKSEELWRPWQTEVLDRVLLFEGPEEADRICSKNGWDIKFARVRRMQLALHYLKPNEIEQSLDMLVDVNLAEEGILRLLFTSVYQISCKVGGDNEVALASRLLALAACFATKMLRRYGLLEHTKAYLQPLPLKHHLVQMKNSRKLYEMAQLLEVIRNLQSRLISRNRRVGQGELADGRDAANLENTDIPENHSPLPIVTVDTVSSETLDALEVPNKEELVLIAPEGAFDSMDSLALPSSEPSIYLENLHEFNIFKGASSRWRKPMPVENSRDMIARWEIDNLDLKSVVKDALQSGRLPLAVIQLHLQRQKELVSEKDYHDLFSEVCEIGRSIAYDLFMKGENGLAMATLQRLGEDVEIILRQLLFGTVRRSLRAQIAFEMQRYGWLSLHELKLLERISVIESLYPSSSFWGTFEARQKNIREAASVFNLPAAKYLKVSFRLCDNLAIECGDIDGVVIGVWEQVNNGSFHNLDCEDNAHAGYWACAAVWSDAWDERTMDRIVLDQPLHMGVHVPWESQLEYHMSHQNLEELYRLLDVIPTSMLSMGTLKISLASIHSSTNIGSSVHIPDYTMYICDAEELEPACMDIPNIKILRSSVFNRCSLWLKMLVEEELAKKFIFVKEYWDSTAEIMPILARAGIIIDSSNISTTAKTICTSSDLDIFSSKGHAHNNVPEALHKLFVHYCVQNNLPNLLDLYLDHHNLVFDANSLPSLLEAAGDCHWAKWLLFLRIKGHEYEASFSNARSNLSRQMFFGSNLSIMEVDEIIRSVDDIAEGGGEIAALATLMYASVPIQKCLCIGSVNRHYNSSCQCTLENLRPGLQRFPTLWRTLVAACFGQDAGCFFSSFASNDFGKSSFVDYAKWRCNTFSSTGGDTSLVQVLPCWFPKAIRRLIKLFVQGPVGWQSPSCEEPIGGSFQYKNENYGFTANGTGTVNAVSWEATIQKSIEELYSSVKENGFGVEHHLHRGRPLAAFNHLLGIRASKLKSANGHQGLSGQFNIQTDVQTILAPLAQSEGSFISSVMPLAIMHFEDSLLVASCAMLLELCGLSASMLRVDIAALRRISSYYTSIEKSAREHISPKGSAFHSVSHEGDFAVSLARALADDYMRHVHPNILEQKDVPDKVSTGKQPSRALTAVLQHLVKASLPLMDEGSTCGSWLYSGNGDGFEFRNQQKDASQKWSLVTEFCQMHQLPLSTKYLAVLANDNDWVGFLTEAQLGSFPIDVVIQVAAQEFSNSQLKNHILTVLKSMQLTRRKSVSSSDPSSVGRNNEVAFVTDSNILVSLELFGILAECERQKNPGESLLRRAKDLRWSLLAMIASCFPDVSPISCLTVWLEITAARETSSIKVNDISSKISKNVGAAVDATNKLSSESRTLALRYNRKNPKRRRIVEPSSESCLEEASINATKSSSSSVVSIAQVIASEEESRKIAIEQSKVSSDFDETLASLSNMVAVLCEQHLFLPLLRAFEMFMPSCSLLPFIRSLQAFSQMRLTEAAALLASFSARIREEPFPTQTNMGRDAQIKTAWISSTAAKAADAMISSCPSAYEKRCLLQLLSEADFGDGGCASAYFRRLYWKINLAEPSLRKDDYVYLGNETLDDASLLTALEKNGHWEQARNWAKQLESSGTSWNSAVHHVTETQAEAMVAEWKEFLWDIPEERAALWSHCQTLFVRHSFPALQAGLFFLKHAEAVEKDITPKELHEMLLLSLQWLSGFITQSQPVYPLHLLREFETRAWLLAVESEAQSKAEGDFTLPRSVQSVGDGNRNSVIEQTASIITKMDNHIHLMRVRTADRNVTKENNMQHQRHLQISDSNSSTTTSSTARMKRRTKNYIPLRRPVIDTIDTNNDSDEYPNSPHNRSSSELSKSIQLQEENVKMEASVSGWEERVRPADLERAVLSLLEFGQITAAKQLQHKLSPAHVPSEIVVVDAALKIAALSSSSSSEGVSELMVDPDVLSVIQTPNLQCDSHVVDALQVLESLAIKCGEGCGRGLCRRIIAVVKAAKVLGLSFSEAFEKRPLELLQLLSLKAQDSLEEAKLLVQTHVMPPASIARILAESFLKGLLAAHRGGYMDSQREEGPAPLLWRFSDFLKWAELCPSEPEVGHSLMRLVMTGQDIPHACEVELLILSHHFYKSSACLDGVDVLVTLAANRVESYVLEGDFSCLARLITGVSNFHALNFILNILIENGQLELLLDKYSSDDSATSKPDAVRGFRLAVLTSLMLFSPHDLDALAMVYSHFDMKHETASLLESRSKQCTHRWLSRRDKDRQNEDLLEAMCHYIEAAEVLSTIDAGQKTHRACDRAFLLSLQIRIPDINWIELSETNARRALVEQSRFQEALIVAEAYNLNQPSEWAPVLWNLMLKPDLIEQFVAEFVAVLPLQPYMLLELARFYRAEVAARGDQSHFSVWLSPGGLPAEWVKHLGRSFRSLLRKTRDLRVRVQLATIATGFVDVIDVCMKVLDKVPENAGPLILRRGHGGAYLPLM